MLLEDFYNKTVHKNDTLTGGWGPAYYGVLSDLINKMSFKHVAEIGIGYGTHAKHMLKNSTLEKLFLVDPMKFYPDDAFAADIMNQTPNVPGENFNELYSLIQKELSPWSDRIQWIRKPSIEVTNTEIPDNSLDCVFIDGDHSYNAVVNDLLFWVRKVKPGGYILGDDYHMEEVANAVHLFAWKMDLDVEFLEKPGTGYKIFQFIKPLQPKRIVFQIENRKHVTIYHWFLLILAGLRHLESPYEKIDIYMPWYTDTGFQDDSLSYFKDKFNFYTNPADISGAIIKKFHGEPLVTHDRLQNEAYQYIREIFLKGKTYTFNPNRRVYLSRNISDTLPSNTCKRKMIINEDCVKKVLDVFGFEYIYLEKCSLEEKIEIFQTSGIILSPHSGGLTMATFTNRQTKIIQIMSNNFYEDHYTILCDVLGIRNYKFSNLTNVDEHYNMNVDCEALTTYLEVHTS